MEKQDSENNKKILIIDTDPGVDDATAITIALFSEKFDIKLITTTAGNVGIEKTTRNALYLVERFNKNVDVCEGSNKPMKREGKDASLVHGIEGLGNFIPHLINKTVLKENAIDKMYEIIKTYPNQVTILELAPHTNLGHLFTKYPDSKNLVKEIVFEGGSPYGKKGVNPHISFNISYDPEAADIVMQTDIPKTIIPSELGRYIAYFTREDVNKIKKTNKTGEFLAQMYEGYINRFGLDITQTNDLGAVMYMLYPNIFKTYKCDIKVDLIDIIGKTEITENKNGKVTFVENVNKQTFFEKFMENLIKLP